MKYMGSKARISKYILPLILTYRKPQQWWVEPFVGGGNIIDKVTGPRLGADCNKYTIDALVAIRDHVADLPKNNTEFTEADYRNLRYSDAYKYKGYAGFVFSYGAKWLGGWRRDGLSIRDYVREGYSNALRQSPLLQGVEFVCEAYQNLQIPLNSLIYCDPPYVDTTKYASGFDSAAFWQWCRQKSSDGHTVFVSEYTAPDDFTCVWSKKIVSSLTRNTGSKIGLEKLYYRTEK